MVQVFAATHSPVVGKLLAGVEDLPASLSGSGGQAQALAVRVELGLCSGEEKSSFKGWLVGLSGEATILETNHHVI